MLSPLNKKNTITSKKVLRNKKILIDELSSIISGNELIKRIIFFDNQDGNILQDYSLNQNNASLSVDAKNLDLEYSGKARVLTLNSNSEYWDFLDSNDLSFGNGTTDSAFSIIFMGKINASGLQNSFLCKADTTTGNTNNEYLFYLENTNFSYFLIRDNSSNSWIGRRTASLSSNFNKFNTYIATYNGSSLTSGIKIYANGTRVDTNNSSSGIYTAMENLNAKVASYFLDSTGNKTYIGNYTAAIVAIISKELSQSEVTNINLLLKNYLGVN